jgi:hypothetical protein
MNDLKNAELLLDSARGVYIPRDFVASFTLSKWQGIPEWAIKACSDPDGEDYWEGWTEILYGAVYTAPDGRVFSLHQTGDGDLWGICYERLTPEEREAFGFEE